MGIWGEHKSAGPRAQDQHVESPELPTLQTRMRGLHGRGGGEGKPRGAGAASCGNTVGGHPRPFGPPHHNPPGDLLLPAISSQAAVRLIAW